MGGPGTALACLVMQAGNYRFNAGSAESNVGDVELPHPLYGLPHHIYDETKKLPKGVISFEEKNVQKDISYILGRIESGREVDPSLLSKPFRWHWMLFEKKLTLWDRIPIQKCLTREEIIIGSLTGGPAFADFLKKARYFTYVASVSLGGDYPEEYVLPGYKGYDSLFRESDLINFAETTDDVDYSFIKTKPFDEKSFREELNLFLDEILPQCSFTEEISTLEWIKPSMSYNPVTEKSFSTRDGLRGLTSIQEGYLGKRTIVQPFPEESGIPRWQTLTL